MSLFELTNKIIADELELDLQHGLLFDSAQATVSMLSSIFGNCMVLDFTMTYLSHGLVIAKKHSFGLGPDDLAKSSTAANQWRP